MMGGFMALLEKIGANLKIRIKIWFWKIKYGERLSVGRGLKFRRGFVINISKSGHLRIGENCFFNSYCSINCRDEIEIGDENLFGEGVKIYDHNHVFNDKNINIKENFRTSRVVIGRRNWFGSNSVILSKAKVGDNNVFGANTIVNSEYDSDNLVRSAAGQIIEKIHYKEGKND